MRLLLFTFLVIQSVLPACTQQVRNGDFEEVNAGGTLAYWGRMYVFPVVIDSSGAHKDSIELDGYFYQPSADAHSGSYALELHNAYNYSSGQAIAGAAGCFSDREFTGFSSPNKIDPGQHISALSFYSRYKPEGEDRGFVRLVLFDGLGNEVGRAEGLIEKSTTYKLYTVPVVYISGDQAVSYSLEFSNAGETGTVHAGTRMWIDDVTFERELNAGRPDPDIRALFQNPVYGVLQFFDGQSHNVILYDLAGSKILEGRHHAVDLSDLPAGVYIIGIRDDRLPEFRKFVKL